MLTYSYIGININLNYNIVSYSHKNAILFLKNYNFISN